LRTADRVDVLSAQPFQYFLIALTGPLILASDLSLMKFIAQAVSFVPHVALSEEVHQRGRNREAKQ
jgi:hypothetical protein